MTIIASMRLNPLCDRMKRRMERKEYKFHADRNSQIKMDGGRRALSAKGLIPMGGKSEKPLVEKIRFHLEEQIIAGRLKPRQRLVEEEIAREMSVSRSPVREALRARVQRDCRDNAQVVRRRCSPRVGGRRFPEMSLSTRAPEFAS